MREIKFRIYNNKTKSWIHGPHKHPELDGVHLFGENIIMGNVIGDVNIQDLNEIEAFQYIKDDINGNGIFEGSIVKDADGSLGVCRYDESFACFEVIYPNWTTLIEGELLVVGNIKDNPELIK